MYMYMYSTSRVVCAAQVQVCDREFDEQQQQRARCSTGAIVVHVLRDAPRSPPLAPPRFLNPCGGASDSDSDSDSGAVLDVRMPLSRPLYLTHLVLAPPAHEAELRVVAVPAAAGRASRRDADIPPSPALSALFFVERSLWANMSLQLEADVPFIFGVRCTQ